MPPLIITRRDRPIRGVCASIERCVHRRFGQRGERDRQMVWSKEIWGGSEVKDQWEWDLPPFSSAIPKTAPSHPAFCSTFQAGNAKKGSAVSVASIRIITCTYFIYYICASSVHL